MKQIEKNMFGGAHLEPSNIYSENLVQSQKVRLWKPQENDF